MDNPLLLANRTAKKLKSLLARQAALKHQGCRMWRPSSSCRTRTCSARWRGPHGRGCTCARGPGATAAPPSGNSPHSPNPIGLHPVEVTAVDAGRVRVRSLEALDGTPILDLKPVLSANVSER